MRAPWESRRLLRLLPGAAGSPSRPPDALRAAADLVAAGFAVALDPTPGGGSAAGLAALVDVLAAGVPAARCRLTVPVGALADDEAATLAERVLDAGLGADLAGPLDRVRALADRVPEVGVVVPAAAPGAEDVCRALADRRVRVLGRGTRRGGVTADLAFVRCLNVLMAAGGHPGVGTSDRRLLAIAGERAAWNERDRESWEYVMTQGVRVEEQRRLLAGGYTVRVAVPSGARR